MRSSSATNIVFVLPICMYAIATSAGSPLPLEIGKPYVKADVYCDEGVAADRVYYNGSGFDYNRSWCTIVSVIRKGDTYRIKEECFNYPVGEGGQSTHKIAVTVKDKTSFTIKQGKESTAYKLCR